MSIIFEQFEYQFDKLQAAHGVTKSAKIIDQWYQEFQDLEYGPFVKAMRRCQYSERFPNWDKFKSEYKNSLGPVNKVGEKSGCQYCHNGKVFYRDYLQKINDVRDLAANCSLCSLNKSPDLIDIDPERLMKDSMGVLRTKEAVEHETKVVAAPPNRNSVNGAEVVRTVFGKDDPRKEAVRRKTHYVESKRESGEAPF